MRIGIIAARLNGTDGVSLETEKWARVLSRMGHEVLYCAGELGGYSQGGTLIPKLYFAESSIQAISRKAFSENAEKDGELLLSEIYTAANEMRSPLHHFIRSNRIDLIIVQNALAIPMNIPLGVCLADLIKELSINTIAVHCDFFWERERFRTSNILELLDTYFPVDHPQIQHVTINSIARGRLKARRGIDSTLIPNVHDFATPPPGIDDYNRDLRQVLGLSPEEWFILQPTRVIQRKGIELALELLVRLVATNPRLFITHRAYDEGWWYWDWLAREASALGVDLQLIDHLVAPQRFKNGSQKIYSLWDAYLNADLVTFPSLYEGFGNALLEAVYFKRLLVVNRYPVYNADIRPLGFDFIELDGYVDDQAVKATRDLLRSPERVQEMVKNNYRLAQEHFSFKTLESKLVDLLSNLK